MKIKLLKNNKDYLRIGLMEIKKCCVIIYKGKNPYICFVFDMFIFNKNRHFSKGIYLY